MQASSSGRIDVHQHTLLPSYRKALQDAALGPNIRLPEWNPGLALETMDRQGIAAAVTSISVPGSHLGDDAKARDLARAINEEAADLGRDNPRFGAFATLPLPNVDLACKEAEYALDELALDGVGLLTVYDGKTLGHPDHDPLFEVLNERSAIVHVHPAVHPSMELVAVAFPRFVLEYPFETTRAAVNLLFADALERFPNIRFILSHGGGTLPFLSWRISSIASYQLAGAPDAERFLRDNFRTALIDRRGSVTPQEVVDLMGRFWFDTALVTSHGALKALRELADPSHILFGSDWPYAFEPNFVRDEVAYLNGTTPFSETELAGIDRDNAISIFRRFQPGGVAQGTL